MFLPMNQRDSSLSDQMNELDLSDGGINHCTLATAGLPGARLIRSAAFTGSYNTSYTHVVPLSHHGAEQHRAAAQEPLSERTEF